MYEMITVYWRFSLYLYEEIYCLLKIADVI